MQVVLWKKVRDLTNNNSKINLNKILKKTVCLLQAASSSGQLKHNQKKHINHLDRLSNCNSAKQIIRVRSYIVSDFGN